MVDTLGVIICIIVIIWLILMIAAKTRKESIKETVTSFREWVTGKIKSK